MNSNKKILLRLMTLLLLFAAGTNRMWAAIGYPTVTMTYVDANNEYTSFGNISWGNNAKAGWNQEETRDNYPFVGVIGSGERSITYILVDASGSNLPTGAILSATLHAKVSGSLDNQRQTSWVVDYNSETSLPSNFDGAYGARHFFGTLRSAAFSTSTNSGTFNDVTFDITNAIKNDDDRKVVLVVYETAEGGGYMKEPWVEIQYEGWNANEFTVDLTELNTTNQCTWMPVLYDANGNDVTSSATIAYTGDIVGSGTNPYPPRLKKAGTSTVTASYGGNTYSYTLNVTGTTVSGTYDATNNKYTFNTVGVITDRIFNQVEGVTMTINGGPTALVVNATYDETLTALKVIDDNGYSHANISGNVPNEGTTGGTFYKFEPTVNGHIYFEGHFRAAKWIKDGNVVNQNLYSTKDFEMEAGSTYYLYNTNPGNAPLLHSYRYEQIKQTVTFDGGNGAVSKGLNDAPFTKTATSDKGGTITYSSSDPAVATVDEGTGQVTIHHAGITIITATAAPINGIPSASASYQLEVNIAQKWIFDNALGANWTTTANEWDANREFVNAQLTKTDNATIIPETAGLLFDNKTGTYSNGRYNYTRLNIFFGQSIQVGAGVKLIIPNLHRGQVVDFMLGSSSGATSARFENVSWLNNRETVGSVTNIRGSDVSYKMVVESDGSVTVTGDNNNFLVNAIYVYNLGETTTGEIHYNGDLPMIEKETAMPHNIFFYDSHGNSLSSNLFGDLYGFTSDNPSLLTVDPNTGQVTVPEGHWLQGTATITCYAKSMDAIKYKDATLTRTITIQSSSAELVRSKNILINDLYYLPMASSADGGLNRTIPNFKLTLTGGNNLMSSADGSMLTMNGGNIKIEPRYASSHAADVYFTNAVAYFSDGTAQTVTLSGTPQEVNLSFHEKEITSIMVKFKSTDPSIDPESLLNTTKTKPGLSFPSESSQIGVGNTVPVIQATSGHKNLRNIEYTITGGADYVELTNNDETLFGKAVGSGTLQAQFTGNNEYFIPSNPETHIVYVVDASGYTASLQITNRLDVEAYCGYDGFAFVNEALTIQPSITDADGNPVDLSNYTVTYTTSDITMAYADAQGGITTGNTPGQVIVAATFTPNNGGETLSTSYQLGVLSGWWDIRTYNNANGHSQLGANDDWNAVNLGQNRDVPDFRFIIRKDDTPLSQTLALMTRKRMRMLYDSRNQVSGGNIHLFGRGVGDNESPNGGGEIRVPVRAGMLIEIYCHTDAIHAEMNISGAPDNNDVAAVTDLEGNDVTDIYIDEGYASYYYLAKNDGVFYIKNPSTNLNFYIGYIRVTDQMVFEYGEETYVDSNDLTNRQFRNPIVNQGSTTMTYAWEPIATNDLCQNLSSDGTITFRSGAYGSMRVFATGSGGPLDGKSGSYVVHAIGMTVADQVNAVVGTNPLTFTPEDQITIATGAGLSAAELKNKVEFSIVSATASVHANIYGAIGDQELVIEGAGTVVVKAKLGAIERLITYNIAGGQLSSLSQVIRKDKPSHTITIEGSGISGVTFDWNRMIADAQGEIKDYVSSLNHNATGNSLTISGFDQIQKGGAIPIYADYVYNGQSHHLEGMLTVAYSSHIWNFEHDLTYEMKDWTPVTGAWTTAATYEKPDDSDTYRDDTKDWCYVRKIGGHTDVSIVYYYNHTSQGLNATVLPSTAGLVINSTKDGRQLGVEMHTDGAHLADLSTGKYVCSNLMLLRGGQFIVPKVKPGQWIEIRWTRHKEDMAERFSMQNLLDVEGTYIDKIYKIGNCFYNIPGNTSTYMFQVASPDDDPSVVLDEDGCVDAVFTCDDNIYISIQQIELHEPGWDYDSSMAQQLKCRVDNATAQLLDSHFVCDGETHTIELLSKDNQNAPNAPQQWEITFDGTLAANGATKSDGLMVTSPSFTYRGGWGKVYVTLTSYSQNQRYVANRNTWIITIGAQPQQTYPYTWDFSKYFTTTKTSVGGNPDDYYEEDPNYTANRTAITETDVTIINPSFELAGGTGWTMVASNQNLHGGLESNYCAESWHSTFILSQTINVSNGIYRLSAQGFYRQDGSDNENLPYLYANDVKQTIPLRTGTENDMNAVSSAFSDGKYFINPITVEVTNGTLTIGVANPVNTNLWCIWDNFTLTRLEDSSTSFTKSTQAHEYRMDIDTWTEIGNNENVITDDYNSRKYWSYYVDGAQLVSRSLGILPETEGLGFSISQKQTGGLTLDMQSTVANPPVASGDFPYTWRNGKLEITGGGTIIVPKPGTGYDGFYIYIRSNVKPSGVINASEVTDDVASANQQYKYHFTANADAVITFSGDVEVYQIGVTNIFKTMHTVGGIGWATESRRHDIDHALIGHLTTNDANAYTVTYDSYDLNTATVALTAVAESGYVPEKDGIVMKQENGAATGTYQVPLFYPAITTGPTLTETEFSSTGNMMMANLEERHMISERDNGTLDDDADDVDDTGDDNGTYTRFLLTNIHWSYTSSHTLNEDEAAASQSADAAGFYRMHIWETTGDKDTKNTLAANTAYMLVPTDNLPVAVWSQQQRNPSTAPCYAIGIRETTDIEEIDLPDLSEGEDGQPMVESWYTISGVKLDGRPTSAGLYICNGRKVVIK